MTLPIVSELTSPPVVGRTYLVPAIWMRRGGGNKPELWWPVHGALHNDVEFFAFEHQHYHVDQRFLTRSHLAQVGNFNDIRGWGAVQRSFASPVHGHYVGLAASKTPWILELPPKPELRRMRCVREAPPNPFVGLGGHVPMTEKFAGSVCKRGRFGLVCPHQQYPLGQTTPDADGVLTCPMHGLRIRASDGVVIGKDASP